MSHQRSCRIHELRSNQACGPNVGHRAARPKQLNRSSHIAFSTLKRAIIAATIFCIRATPALAQATRQLLEQYAYEIVTATDFKQVEAGCANIQFDLALIGDDNFEPRIKKAIALLLKEHCPDVPILEICKDTPVTEASEFVQEGSPDELVKAVRRMLGKVKSPVSATR
jgi:DNA-binding NtrC family response regulator